MKKLNIEQNQLRYLGNFAQPMFSLISPSRTALPQIYEVFSPYGIRLEDFRYEGAADIPASLELVIHLQKLGQIKVRMECVEWSASDFDDEDIESFPVILKRVSEWLRSTQDVSFRSHTFVYACHGRLSEGDSSDFLLSLPDAGILNFGESLGSAIYYNARDQFGGRIQFVVNHSEIVETGLFAALVVNLNEDAVDYKTLGKRYDKLFTESLEKIGLQKA
jgi:hypothetical protein